MIVSRTPSFGVLAALLLAMTLGGCAQQMDGVRPDATPAPANSPQAVIAAGDYARAAQLYMQASTRSSSRDRQRQLRLEAGLAAAQAGDASMAQQILASFTPSSLSNIDRGRYQLAKREISIASLPPSQALDRLPPPSSGTAPRIAERVWEKRAQLHFEQNDRIAGIGALVQRGVWLVDDRMLRGNDNRIYEQSLDTIASGQGPQSPAARNADQTTLGWLALADIGQRRWASREERDRALADWEQRFAQHPATRAVLLERFDYRPSTSPRQRDPGQSAFEDAPRPQSDAVALALPLSGDFGNAAKAIRDGFMFAYERDTSAPARPQIYDTSNLSASALLQRAQSDRIGILVGPLDKPKVTQMARLNSRIPTIGLNYSDAPINHPGFYQFALSPEDEARAVARHAADKGQSRALALVPGGDWGSRVFDAFRSAFEKRGGQLLDYATYKAGEPDHRKPIRAVLRNRSGADFIFVAGQPSQARLIRSQLRYYRARNLPMYTTSHAYTGTPNPGEDIDLNGVGFVDMSWVVGQGDFLATLRNEAVQNYPNTAKHYERLFAMGMDAWRLTDRIAERGLEANDVFEGMTGVLKLNDNGRIQRYLAWAVFRSGEPHLMQMPSPADARNDNASPGRRDPWAQR